MQTHETYVQAVAALAIARLTDPAEQEAARAVKLTYGSGPDGVRGITYYQRWTGQTGPRPFVAISALAQEDWVQLAGTTIHELAHVIAGWNAGHGPDWRGACERLGLRRARAAGHKYHRANFEPDLRDAIARLPMPDDGAPVPTIAGQGAFGFPLGGALKPCGAGIGTRGGRSRGKGSGSRLRLWQCACEPPVRVRVASDHFRAHCDCCARSFVARP